MRRIRLFFRFWYDFVVGDDGWIAIGVATVLAIGGALVALDPLPDSVLAPTLAAAIVGVVLLRIFAAARPGRRRA